MVVSQATFYRWRIVYGDGAQPQDHGNCDCKKLRIQTSEATASLKTIVENVAAFMLYGARTIRTSEKVVSKCLSSMLFMVFVPLEGKFTRSACHKCRLSSSCYITFVSK